MSHPGVELSNGVLPGAVYDGKEELEAPKNNTVLSDQIIYFPRLAPEGEEPVLLLPRRDLGRGETGGYRVPLQPTGLRRDDHRGRL